MPPTFPSIVATSVYAGSDLDGKRPNRVHDRLSAADRPSRSIEGREEPVARRVHFDTAVSADDRASERVVAFQQRTPGLVSEISGSARRTHNVGEHHRGERPFEL
jgi:hypothetical protein